MDWEPITLSELNSLISNSLLKLPPKIINKWENISITPIKWMESTHGEVGNGFWAVAKFNNKVIWYNDIEDGFNLSDFSSDGVIKEYSCEQLDLDHILNRLYG